MIRKPITGIEEFCEWVILTCLAVGCQLSTALKVAAVYAEDWEKKHP